MDKTFDAIKIMSGQNDTPLALVWWDGTTICSNSDSFLRRLKKEEIQGYQFGDGEEFFNAIPSRFSNGYVYCKKAKVKDGKEV